VRRSHRSPWASLAAGAALALLGCPGSDEHACRDHEPPAGFDAAAPTVSFARDVFPVFRQSCAFSTCHGAAAGTANGVFLGGQDPSRVHAAIVDVRSSLLPRMSFVVPGAPRESFLLRKMDGSHCVLASECRDGDCGDSMPRGEALLPVETRDVIRRWIAQGAAND
jgi:hypothetical protein